MIDPGTGRPSASPWEEVTVCGATCLAADVAAKAAFLLGADGPDWLDEPGCRGGSCAGRGLRERELARGGRAGVPACT